MDCRGHLSFKGVARPGGWVAFEGSLKRHGSPEKRGSGPKLRHWPKQAGWRRVYGSGNSVDGHNCVNLVPDSFWIFFAQPHNAAGLELVDDCEGALAVSPLRAPRTSGDALSQMEADFKAGLGDSDPEARLASIQRLAGLGMPASRDALREVISYGTETESKWALFALLKTGDGSGVSLA